MVQGEHFAAGFEAAVGLELLAECTYVFVRIQSSSRCRVSEIKVSAKVSANSFGTFLETVNPVMQARANEDAARQVLSLISSEAKPVVELLLASPLSIGEFSAALDHLQKIGIVDRFGSGKDEKVRLAPKIVSAAAE